MPRQEEAGERADSTGLRKFVLYWLGMTVVGCVLAVQIAAAFQFTAIDEEMTVRERKIESHERRLNELEAKLKAIQQQIDLELKRLRGPIQPVVSLDPPHIASPPPIDPRRSWWGWGR